MKATWKVFQKALMLGATLLALPLYAQESDDPQTELASFQIADGFEISLFASETNQVIKPIQMRFDALGRIWVICSTVYPQLEPGQIPNDKVLIIEDRNGDGRADKTTIFADGLMIPTGLEIGGGGAYVGHGTELLLLRDNNGDDRADERHVVFRGFGTGDNHQNINSFLWGPGGELWMSQGLHTHSRVETLRGLVRLDQAGLWRFRPGLKKLEGFYGAEHEPQNPWGYVFTDWGEPIVLAGNNSSPIYPVPGLVSRRKTEAPPLIWKKGDGRKVSGGDIVGTTHFPESWQGKLIVGGYINNAVWALKISEDGAGFSIEDFQPLLRSSSRKFRPVDAKFGPDGALYICDWYNPVIGHYQASFRDPDRDKTHGRIWRITARNRPLTPAPALAGKSVPLLVQDLKSKDRWTRQFAKRLLAELPQSTNALHRALGEGTWTDHNLKEALGVFQSLEIVEPSLLRRLAGAADPGARAYAAGVVGLWSEQLPQSFELLRRLIADPEPRVRLQALVAASYFPSAQSMELALQAADLPMDRFLSYAFRQTVFALKPYWLPALKSNQLSLGEKNSRLGALIRADATGDTLEILRELSRSGNVQVATRESYLRILTEIGDGNDLVTILELTDTGLVDRLLPDIQAAAPVSKPERIEAAIQAIQALLKGSAQRRQAGVYLASIWKINELGQNIRELALNESEKLPVRKAALKALENFGGENDRQIIRSFASEPRHSLKPAAIAILSVSAPENAASLASDWLAETTLSDTESVGDTREIFTQFLQRQGGSKVLATALAAKPPTSERARIGMEVISMSGRGHDQLMQVLSRASSSRTFTPPTTPESIRAFAEEVRKNGNGPAGKAVYSRPELGCIACHSINGIGGNIGPNLSALGTAQPAEFIIGAILDPQREVKEGFLSTSVLTKDGNEYQGYLVRQTSEELMLKDVLQNQEIRLARSKVASRKENGSIMPAGLVEGLSSEEFRDLVRYLSELGKSAGK